MKSLSNQFRARRKALGLPQQEIARRAGLEQPLVSGFERGTDVRFSTLRKLASALDLELVAVPRERLADVRAMLAPQPAPPTSVAVKSLLERFRVPDDDEI